MVHSPDRDGLPGAMLPMLHHSVLPLPLAQQSVSAVAAPAAEDIGGSHRYRSYTSRLKRVWVIEGDKGFVSYLKRWISYVIIISVFRMQKQMVLTGEKRPLREVRGFRRKGNHLKRGDASSLTLLY
jgi:hypothetical protein